MKKRLLSAALALAMVLTMLPLSALPAFATTASTLSSDMVSPDGTEPSKPKTVSVTYREKGYQFQAASGNNAAVVADDAGWYYWGNAFSNTTPKVNELYSVSDGVIASTGASGNWYQSVEYAVVYGNANQVKLLGNGNINLEKANASLTVDLNGYTLTIDSSNLEQNRTADEKAQKDNTRLTTLTLTSTVTAKGTVSGNISAKNQSFTLNLTNVTMSGTVELKLEKNVAGSLTVNPTRSTVGDITLDNSQAASTSANTLTVKSDTSVVGNVQAYDAKVAVTATSGQSSFKAIKSQKDSNTNTATPRTGAAIDLAARTTASSVVIYGGTSTLKMNGMSTVLKVWLYGAKTGDNPSSPTAIPAWSTTVTVDGTSTITEGIQQVSGDLNGHKIDIKGGSTVGSINMSAGGKSTITIADSYIQKGTTKGAIQIAAGTLNITNSTAGDVTVGKPGETSGVTITVGANGRTDTSKVGDIKKANSSSNNVATPTLNLYDGAEVGKVGNITADNPTGAEINKNIYGGTLGSPVTKSDLRGTLANGYQIRRGTSGSYTYTYTAKFQDLVDKYSVSNDSQFLATLVNDDDAVTNADAGNGLAATATFQWDQTIATSVLTKLKVTKGVFINLPTVVNSADVSYWYNAYDENAATDGEGLTPVENPYRVMNDVTLVANVSAKTNRTVTGIKAADEYSNSDEAKWTPITATLSGSTINLSGAVVTKGGAGSIRLYFEVDGSYGAQYVNVGWDSSTGKIQLDPETGATNVSIPVAYSNQVKVYDKVYTVTGTGLKERVSRITVVLENGDRSIVVPNASAGMSGSYVELGKDVKKLFEDGTKSSVDFSQATDVQAALNALIANLSQSTVDGYISQARSAMATYNTRNKVNNRNNWAASEFDGYNQVLLTPYLEISSSNPTITGDASNTIMTLTMTLKARYTVVNSDGDVAYKDIVNGEKTPWETAVSLSAAGDGSATQIKLALPNTTLVLGSDPSYVHHVGRVYVINWTAQSDYVETTISNANGFTNTSFVINNTAPLAIVRTSTEQTAMDAAVENGEADGQGEFIVDDNATGIFFDNLQSAVDAVKNGGTITVCDNYSGSINVTGEARKFTIQAKDDRTTVTLTSINGANTTSKFDTSSNVYEIQLTSSGSATVTSGDVTIRVSSVSNGSATVNMSTASVGTTVTITPNPSSGYAAATPTVTTNNGAAVAVTANSNGTYSFVVPSGATSVTVSPAFVRTGTSSAVPFNDVSTTAWYYDGVVYCYTHYAGGERLMEGTVAGTTFGANSLMTRAELVQVLWRIAGKPTETARVTFTDLPSNAWYYNAVTWAANHGYVDGYGDGTVQPNRNISRQELAQILWKFAGRPAVSVNLASRYADGQGVAGWAQSAMQWAAGRNILSGRSSTTLNKLDAYEAAYRSELAVTIMKYHQIYVTNA